MGFRGTELLASAWVQYASIHTSIYALPGSWVWEHSLHVDLAFIDCCIPDTLYEKFIEKMSFVDKEVLMRISEIQYNPNEVVALGDQLMTDVFAANRMNYTSVLVKAIDRKTEKWTTRINRLLEGHVLKVIEKKYPEVFENSLRVYKEENYGRD